MIIEETGKPSNGLLVEIIRIKSIRSLMIILLLFILGVILLPEIDTHQQSGIIDSTENIYYYFPDFLRGHSKCVNDLCAANFTSS